MLFCSKMAAQLQGFANVIFGMFVKDPTVNGERQHEESTGVVPSFLSLCMPGCGQSG